MYSLQPVPVVVQPLGAVSSTTVRNVAIGAGVIGFIVLAARYGLKNEHKVHWHASSSSRRGIAGIKRSLGEVPKGTRKGTEVIYSGRHIPATGNRPAIYNGDVLKIVARDKGTYESSDTYRVEKDGFVFRDVFPFEIDLISPRRK